LEAAMVPWKWSTVWVVVATAFVLAGCSSKAAAPRKETRSTASLAAVSPAQGPAKSAPRESAAFATYNNSEYGASFRYPRNYALVEGAIENLPNARSQQELTGEQPGVILVATVVVPDDAYPNTTFAGGSVQFAVNPYLTEKGCRDDLISRAGDSNEASGASTIQGVVFAWAESDAGDANTEFFGRNYAGFSNGTCYEFFARVGAGSGANEDGMKPANQKKILGHLEKIVLSLQIEPKTVSILDKTPAAQGNGRRH
jgi:hypothetical protein